MVVSARVGGGIVLNGTLLEGADGNAEAYWPCFVDPEEEKTLMEYWSFGRIGFWVCTPSSPWVSGFRSKR